ncbi:MAG TPA: energy transducer TonB [Steroidobacteraceae bacterium]|nr:energy transducer TonB [Steroidobacteraceae bacterium]
MSASNKVSARPSGTAAAEPSKASKRRIEVVIVGAGDETLIEVGPALGDEYRTFSVDTAAEIADLAATSWIGLYDATTQDAGRSAFAQLETQYGRQPWIVLCSDDDRPNWRDVLSRGAACAVIARGELDTASLTAALVRAAQRLTDSSHAGSTAGGFTARSPVVWGAAAAVIAVAGIGWWLSHSHHATPTAAAPAASHKMVITGGVSGHAATAGTKQAPQAPASVEDLLSQARIAFRDPNAQLPKPDMPLQGTSALELYGAVLLQQPKNDEALDGVRRLQDVARLRVQNALAAGDAETAARLLAILQRAAFAPEELRTLEAAVAAARPKQLAAQARSAMAAGNLPAAHQLIDQLVALVGERSPTAELRKEFDARTLDAQLTTAAEQVRAAISSGSLLEPAADNARTRFAAMRELNRTGPQTVAVQHELLAALLRRVQAAIGRQDLEGAQQTLSAAQDFGSKAELADARGALDSALAARRAAEAASAAAAVRASAPTAIAAAVVPVLSPKPIRNLQVDYPPAALANNVKGYVVVEFMLNPNGSASGATVVEASPRATFDHSALAAVKRATFSTAELADPKKAQHARFRINYSVSDTASQAPTLVLSRTTEAAAETAPATAPAANAAPAAPPPILSPKPTHPLEVNYPKVALELNKTGYVVVEFMLNPDGTPGSPTVIDSSPAKMFDYEAIEAVKRARFVTTNLADPTKPQRARVKINFKGS